MFGNVSHKVQHLKKKRLKNGDHYQLTTHFVNCSFQKSLPIYKHLPNYFSAKFGFAS